VRRIFVVLLALAVLGAATCTDAAAVRLTWQKRAVQKSAAARARGEEVPSRAMAQSRFVDMGLVLRVVRMDLEHGTELIEGCPPMVVVGEHRRGGMIDTRGRRRNGKWVPDFCGASLRPHVMYCSEDAEELILHGDHLPDRLLVYGSEGAGKTRVLAQWFVFRAIEATGAGYVIGATSPTTDRSEEVKEALEEMMPAHWFAWQERRRTFRLRNGIRIALKSTHQSSKKAGSRMQSHNFGACGSDEIQDSLDQDADIEMRGRKAPRGRYKRLNTATSKDTPEFRDWREKRLASGMWVRKILFGPRSPFVFPRFWEDKAATLDKREYRRRVLCEDLPPENRVYYGFERDRNILVRPDVARDVSEEVLGLFASYQRRGAGFALLAGHDPGEIKNVTTFLKPYLYKSSVLWLVVGRLITERTTAEQHAAALKRHVQKEFGLNYDPDRMDPDAGMQRVLVFIDPHGRGESRTDYQTVYGAMQRVGLDVFSAGGDAKVIQGKARRNMMNALMYPETGEARLAVVRDIDGELAAPELVAAFESLERDDQGHAERGPKDETDQTHHPVSVGYALWPFEAPAVSSYTRQRALKTRAAA
jgi:hypothetical protein